MKTRSFWQSLGWPGYVVLVLLIGVGAFFFYELITFDEAPDAVATAMTAEEVDALLVNADPVRGEQLTVAQGCAACHVQGAVNGIAPPFEGVGERAATRVEGLAASAYLYDSIVHPTDYLVEGYAPSMAQDYGDRLTREELADVVAYLLTQ
jgi:mono/diheme cytochrome c family protein